MLEFDGGTLLVRDADENVPYVEWDDRVEEYRAPAYRYRDVLEWPDAWKGEDDPPSSAGESLPTRDDALRHRRG